MSIIDNYETIRDSINCQLLEEALSTEEFKQSTEYPYLHVNIDGTRIFNAYDYKFSTTSVVANGYRKISVTNISNSKKSTIKVAQLVADAWLGYIRPSRLRHYKALRGTDLVCNHIDEDKLNDHVSNLEVITSRKNTLYSKPIPKSSGIRGVNTIYNTDEYVVKLSTNQEELIFMKTSDGDGYTKEQLGEIWESATNFIMEEEEYRASILYKATQIIKEQAAFILS